MLLQLYIFFYLSTTYINCCKQKNITNAHVGKTPLLIGCSHSLVFKIILAFFRT